MSSTIPHRRNVVTGLGSMSALGRGCEALWAAIEAGRDGMRPVARFSTSEFGAHLAATFPGLDGARDNEEIVFALASSAAREAWEEAGVGRSGVAPGRIGLVLGTSYVDKDGRAHGLAERLARDLAIEGPVLTVSTACSSSTGALGLAADLLRGPADIVLAGGADVLSPEVFAGFHALGVLSPEKCAPFSLPPGTTLGEGAGFMVLEPGGQAERRGAGILATIAGYGLSADAFHETSPEPSGRGVARAIVCALRDAGLKAEDIGYVNAHGSGTASNDASECQGIARVFGERSARIPVSSSKSFLGHAQGAAGILEAIVTVLAMRRGVVPPTLHFKGPRPHCPLDAVASQRPRPHVFDHAVSINSAFGGANAAVVLSRAEAGKKDIARRPVLILGAGAVGPHGTDLESLASALKGRTAPDAGPPIEIDRLLPMADPRGLDPTTVSVTAAAALALRDAGLDLQGEQREKTGLILGSARISPASNGAFFESIRRRGLRRLSAAAFARFILNAPAGFCTKILSLRGPTSTLSTGPGSGLAAVLYGAMLLSLRDDVDVIVAGGADEDSRGDSAACVALGAAACNGRPAPVMVGWGLAGRGAVERASAAALDMAGLGPSDIRAILGPGDPARLFPSMGWQGSVPHLDPSRTMGWAEASSGVLALAAALPDVRDGGGPVLVYSGESASMSAALVVTGGCRVS